MFSPTSFADTRLRSTRLHLGLSGRNSFWTARRKSRSSRSAAWHRSSGSDSRMISQTLSPFLPDPMADGSTLRYFAQTAASHEVRTSLAGIPSISITEEQENRHQDHR